MARIDKRLHETHHRQHRQSGRQCIRFIRRNPVVNRPMQIQERGVAWEAMGMMPMHPGNINDRRNRRLVNDVAPLVDSPRLVENTGDDRRNLFGHCEIWLPPTI